MSWVEKLLIVPTMSASDMDKMVTSLSTRFSTVAKKFGKGLIEAITGGGIIGAALAFVEKLISPLKAIQEAVDATLSKGQDLSVRAAEYGSTPAHIAELQAMAKASGNAPDTANLWLEKFKQAVTQAQVHPEEPSSVRNFVGQKDLVQAFLTWSENMKKLSPLQQGMAQTEVLGARQQLNAAAFFQSDFGKLHEIFSHANMQTINKGAENDAKLLQHKNTIEALSELEHFGIRSGRINRGVVDSEFRQKEIKENALDEMLKHYKELQIADEAVDKTMIELQKAIVALTAAIIKQFAPHAETQEQLKKNNALRGVLGVPAGPGRVQADGI